MTFYLVALGAALFDHREELLDRRCIFSAQHASLHALACQEALDNLLYRDSLGK
ncbi:hypothetical protein SynMEDNS5_01788 [Synechococcus sp. MEDNS5]|uniref:hypothetical protein n=1 Tax=Synechococcus sp. MEDNS5 TaxID=1442554 RepID=UPI00164943E7|nr:hypothetical protein [Synechococcus sp. MEDNS5]QNJ06503.1 hypothetical protein SynMEDNS5_01788 [Synechococcus sp. MEDNS5]